MSSEDPTLKLSREEGEFASPGQRGGRDGKPQHTQTPSKKREDARRYKSKPKQKRDSRRYYHLVCKRNPKCMQRRKEYRKKPEKYERRKTPLREAALRFVREAGEIVLYDQENPSNREIHQPGDNVGYEATSPSHYRISPDSKGGVPSGHGLPNMHHDDANPATSRVVPDSMKQTLQENLTYKSSKSKLTAAAISPENLPPGSSVQVVKTSFGKGGWRISVFSPEGEKTAHISISKPLGVGPCLGAYEVDNSWSEVRGLGPLVYDIALELAGSSGLMADRREVSEDARRVWSYYLHRRSDVKSVQLDNLRIPTNEDPEDDCLQSSSGMVWQESPTSRVYYKPSIKVLPELRRLGLLVAEAPPQGKTATLISEIVQNCSPDLAEKSKGVKYTRKALKPNGMSTWTAPGSKGETYTIRVKPIQNNKSIKAVVKMPIQVSCTCPFFRWQGPEHWAKANDYLYGKPAGSATQPTKKDPAGNHWACKHVLAVLDLVRKHKIAGNQDFSGYGELAPFPDSFFSSERLARRYAAQNLTEEELKSLSRWWGRGKGHAQDSDLADLIRDLGVRTKMRKQKSLFRGLSLPNGVFNPENETQVLSYAKGLRSWSRDKRSANYYAKTQLSTSADSVLYIWENPAPQDLVLDSGSLDANAKKLGLPTSSLDTSEVIADPRSLRIVSIDTTVVGNGGVEVSPGKWKRMPVLFHTVTVSS